MNCIAENDVRKSKRVDHRRLIASAVLLSTAAPGAAESLAEVSWWVNYNVSADPGLVVTYNEVYPSKIFTQRTGSAIAFADFLDGGTAWVEWDAYVVANNPDRAVISMAGPLRDVATGGPRPIPIFTVSNPSSTIANMTFNYSTTTHMTVFTTLPFGYAGGKISLAMFGGAPGALAALGSLDETCATRQGCTADRYLYQNYAPVHATVAPASSYEFWVKDARLLAYAGSVPEPTVWAMMLVGFGFVGGSLRRRNRLAPAIIGTCTTR